MIEPRNIAKEQKFFLQNVGNLIFETKSSLPNQQNISRIFPIAFFYICAGHVGEQLDLKDKILTILGHFSQYLEKEKDLFYDAQEIWEELTRKGFSDDDIEFAVDHIERMALEAPGVFWNDDVPVHRSYSTEEMTKLSPSTRGFLWKLKMRGIIDHALEDEIVQKALDLEEPPGLSEIKTVAALTVFGYEHKFQRQHRYLNVEANLH